jgi:acyl-CoA dehydrogenase
MSSLPPLSDDVLERAFVDNDAVSQAWTTAGALVEEALAIEAKAGSPPQALAALVRFLGTRGLLGLVVPEVHGGSYPEVRSIALCLARERLGYASPLVELAFAMQALGSYPLVIAGSDVVKATLLPRVAAGDAIAAFAITEEEAGSDVGNIETAAEEEDGGYRLTGEKKFISNAGVASFYTVFAATAPKGQKRRLSAFVVEASQKGVSAVPQSVLGGHPIGRLRLDGVKVPASHLLGAEGDGMAIALETLHKLRPTVGAAALGFGQRALNESLAHTKSRVQFGVPLADQQAVQLQLADMACDLEAARLLVYRAAAVADLAAALKAQNGEEEPRQRSRVARTGSMAKLMATEAAFRVVDRAVQLFGGRGVEHGHTVARLYEDVRALRIYEGASDVQKLLVARELLRG